MITETYKQFRERQQKEFESIPMAFAFSDKQFEEGMQKLGLDPKDTSKVCSVGGGGFMRKTDIDTLAELTSRHEQEQEEVFKNDDFMLDAILYQLWNHEYGYTYNVKPALEALGLSKDEERVSRILKMAIQKYKEKGE